MCWVNAFITAANEHREVSVGGRRANDSVSAWLNCDTRVGQLDMRVGARVSGPGRDSRERRRHGDQRTAHFHVRLPAASEACSVDIEPDSNIRFLDQKDANELLATSLGTAAQLIEELKKRMTGVPRVSLPGSVDLVHALACVKFVNWLDAAGAQRSQKDVFTLKPPRHVLALD